MRQNVLLIVSLLEGKNFAGRVSGQLIVEVSFGGEILTSDPVEVTDKPVFDAELAWELDRQGLHLHRLQRSPLKLQCFLCDGQSRKLENWGYLILDIRNAKENQAEHTWCRLLNTKLEGHKPELLIGLYLEYNSAKKESVVPELSRNVSPISSVSKSPPSPSVPKAKGTFSSEYLKPKLNSRDGYYQIGPPRLCTEFFSLSITLVFAENLGQLVGYKDSESARKNYSFRYSLLGNEVTTETFHDLSKADFPAEKASVRIRSSLNALQSFLKKQPNLMVCLLCDGIVIAEATISMDSLVRANKIEGVFALIPLQNPSNLTAGVGVSVALQMEQTTTKNSKSEDQNPPPLPEEVPSAGNSQNLKKERVDNAKTKSKSAASSVSLQDSLDAVPTFWAHDTFPKSEELQQGLIEEERKEVKPSKPSVATEDDARHFRFALDLKTLGMQAHVQAFSCFLRYTYPFFGTPVPILTHPCVRVAPPADVLLPHGYCSFDFVTSADNLQNTFCNIPLIVEVLEEVAGYAEGRLLGMAKICLHLVLDAPKSRVVGANGRSTEKRSASTRVPVVSPDGRHQGTLQVALALDDLGPADLSKLFLADGEVSAPEVLPLVLELELWKEKQQTLFREQLRAREREHLRTLSAQWKERDVEREVLVQTRLRECRQQEERLKRALRDVEFREGQLSLAEESVRRVRSECEQRLESEREKTRNADEERRKLQQALREKEGALQDFREKIQGSDEVRLRSELDMSNLEKSELRRKLEAVTSAKNRYKEQWGRSLKRISSLQQRLHLVQVESNHEGERSSLENEKMALARIKDEVEALKRRIHTEGPSDEYVGQLTQERDMLLATGVYSKSDRIILELEKHIADASVRLSHP